MHARKYRTAGKREGETSKMKTKVIPLRREGILR